MMTVDPKRVVEAGYNTIAADYLEWLGRVEGDPRLRFPDASTTRLPAAATVLDLGCGAGTACTAALAEHHDVLGVDVSEGQLALARHGFPEPVSSKEDMTRLRFAPGSFDAVTAFYSMRDQQAR
jgi:ubiquinone/menaquinone biosynthesis C-methylase UbiE